MVVRCSGGLQPCRSSPRPLLFSPSRLFLFCPTSRPVTAQHNEVDSGDKFRREPTPRATPSTVWPHRFPPTSVSNQTLALKAFYCCLILASWCVCVCVCHPSLALLHLGFLSVWCVCVCVCARPLSLFHFSSCDPYHCSRQPHSGSILVYSVCVCVCVCARGQSISALAASFQLLVGLCAHVHVCYVRAHTHTYTHSSTPSASLSVFAL